MDKNYNRHFDDEKMLLIESLPDANAIIVVWFKLLCMAGKMNNSGVFIMNNKIAYTDAMLSTIFRMNENTVKLALKTFEEFGMIDMIDGVITIPNWHKHQSLDALEKRREYQRELMRKRRKQQKMLCNANSYANSDTNVSTLEGEEEKEREEEKKKNNNKPAKHKHGEFQNVLLSDAEVEKLSAEYGDYELTKAIKFLDEYIEEKGYKSKNHNLALRRWVFDAIAEKKPKKKNDIDDFYRMAAEFGGD